MRDKIDPHRISILKELILVSTLLNPPQMEEAYKQHQIEIEVQSLGCRWCPVIQVSWSESDVSKLRIWIERDRNFATVQEAEVSGRSTAKKWIDSCT
jgi:hypothetical protein